MAEYIEREAAVKAVRKIGAREYDQGDINCAALAMLICGDIRDLPAASVRENVTGRWIWDDEGYHCSECLYHAYGNTGEVLTGQFIYCPWCGAKMEGDDAE